MKTITAARAHELLDYQPNTGKFFWRSAAGKWGRIPAGTEAGSCNGDGRRYLRLDGGNFCGSQIAWLMTNGEWPSDKVISLNGIHNDTRQVNLALASTIEKPDLSAIDLTHAELKRQLDYDAQTGIFTWKRTGRRGVRHGRRAGNLDPNNGHRKIRLNEREYLAQRLAWFYVNGEWPDRMLRFLDGNQDNVAIGNLALPQFDARTPDGKNAYQRGYRARNFESFRNSDLRKSFGADAPDLYQYYFERQNGLCKTCLRPERATRNGKVKWLALDHRHSDGVARGLLCADCNTSLGKLAENVETMKRLIAHVEEDYLANENVFFLKKKGLT